MSLDPDNGYIAVSGLADLNDAASLPMFKVQPVTLDFDLPSDFVAAQAANNVLVLALSSGRLIRIDLDRPRDIDDIDLPKKSSDTGIIRRIFLDPTASHLVISTTLGENYYLHAQSRQPRLLARLKGVTIECIAWNPSLPTASTREIIVGASDGNLYEIFIEPSTEFYRREEKYLKGLYKVQDGSITGLWLDAVPSAPDLRRILVATHSRLLVFVGSVGRQGNEGGGSIYTKLFETATPQHHDVSNASASAPSMLVVSPDSPEKSSLKGPTTERMFAWLSSQGVYHSKLLNAPATPDVGKKILSQAKSFPKAQLPTSQTGSSRRKSAIQSSSFVSAILLTHWHIIYLFEDRIIAVNVLDHSIVYDQLVLEPNQTAVSLVADQKSNTFWLFTTTEIFEIVLTEEDRDVWKIMLKEQKFDAALEHAKTSQQKDAVATASGDYLIRKGQFFDAAGVYGKSTKAFEHVALTFIDAGEQDALRKYLLTKLPTFKRSSVMQRTMIASWLVEIFMSKLDALDDTITTKAELSETTNPVESKEQLSTIRTEYREFVTRYRSDLNKEATYDIIGKHGREAELLYFATVANDYSYVLAYWIQRERWSDALTVLMKQTDADVFYEYSTVLMNNVAPELVDVLTRQSNIEPRNIIPALLSYNMSARLPLAQNQAVRYLLFVINQMRSTDAAIHNTLISIYASHSSKDESALLAYLEAQSHKEERSYDADFALRLCILHKRIQSCVHIYSSMEQYSQAVELALKYNEVDLASLVADRPEENPALRKKLWLAVAKRVISQSDGIKTAIEFLKRCDLLKIEDLIPFFPDFVIIDDFKEEICTALEDYSRSIDSLKQEMDESSTTAQRIKEDIAKLDSRYAIVEPGEKCFVCGFPLLSRQFWVFPCQHAFHGDCLAIKIVESGGVGRGKKVRDLQLEVSRGVSTGKKRERAVKELDDLVAASCILCSEFAIKLIDEPFVLPTDDKSEWAL